MECYVTVVKFDYEYLLRIKANVDVRRSIMRVAYTKTIFCLPVCYTLRFKKVNL